MDVDPREASSLRTTASKRKSFILSSDTPKKKIKSVSSEPQDGCRDVFCWKCHSYVSQGRQPCSICPRVFHHKCLLQLGKKPTDHSWICGVCEDLKKYGPDSKPSYLKDSSHSLSENLSFVFSRIKEFKEGSVFENPVDLKEHPVYGKIAVKPVCLSELEYKIKAGSYFSCEQFLADVQWIIHNCYVFNSAERELLQIAKTLGKLAKAECDEIVNCSDCYYNGNTLSEEDWFIETCRVPHVLVWAKVGRCPYWPSKVISFSRNDVRVRFFGDHTRAVVPSSSCYLFTKYLPRSKTKDARLDDALEEIMAHIKKLEDRFGEFHHHPTPILFEPKDDDSQFRLLLPKMELQKEKASESEITSKFEVKRNSKSSKKNSNVDISKSNDISDSKDISKSSKENSMDISKSPEVANAKDISKSSKKNSVDISKSSKKNSADISKSPDLSNAKNISKSSKKDSVTDISQSKDISNSFKENSEDISKSPDVSDSKDVPKSSKKNGENISDSKDISKSSKKNSKDIPKSPGISDSKNISKSSKKNSEDISKSLDVSNSKDISKFSKKNSEDISKSPDVSDSKDISKSSRKNSVDISKSPDVSDSKDISKSSKKNSVDISKSPDVSDSKDISKSSKKNSVDISKSPDVSDSKDISKSSKKSSVDISKSPDVSDSMDIYKSSKKKKVDILKSSDVSDSMDISKSSKKKRVDILKSPDVSDSKDISKSSRKKRVNISKSSKKKRVAISKSSDVSDAKNIKVDSESSESSDMSWSPDPSDDTNSISDSSDNSDDKNKFSIYTDKAIISQSIVNSDNEEFPKSLRKRCSLRQLSQKERSKLFSISSDESDTEEIIPNWDNQHTRKDILKSSQSVHDTSKSHALFYSTNISSIKPNENTFEVDSKLLSRGNGDISNSHDKIMNSVTSVLSSSDNTIKNTSLSVAQSNPLLSSYSGKFSLCSKTNPSKSSESLLKNNDKYIVSLNDPKLMNGCFIPLKKLNVDPWHTYKVRTTYSEGRKKTEIKRMPLTSLNRAELIAFLASLKVDNASAQRILERIISDEGVLLELIKKSGSPLGSVCFRYDKLTDKISCSSVTPPSKPLQKSTLSSSSTSSNLSHNSNLTLSQGKKQVHDFLNHLRLNEEAAHRIKVKIVGNKMNQFESSGVKTDENKKSFDKEPSQDLSPDLNSRLSQNLNITQNSSFKPPESRFDQRSVSQGGNTSPMSQPVRRVARKSTCQLGPRLPHSKVTKEVSLPESLSPKPLYIHRIKDPVSISNVSLVMNMKLPKLPHLAPKPDLSSGIASKSVDKIDTFASKENVTTKIISKKSSDTVVPKEKPRIATILKAHKAHLKRPGMKVIVGKSELSLLPLESKSKDKSESSGLSIDSSFPLSSISNSEANRGKVALGNIAVSSLGSKEQRIPVSTTRPGESNVIENRSPFSQSKPKAESTRHIKTMRKIRSGRIVTGKSKKRKHGQRTEKLMNFLLSIGLDEKTSLKVKKIVTGPKMYILRMTSSKGIQKYKFRRKDGSLHVAKISEDAGVFKKPLIPPWTAKKSTSNTKKDGDLSQNPSTSRACVSIVFRENSSENKEIINSEKKTSQCDSDTAEIVDFPVKNRLKESSKGKDDMSRNDPDITITSSKCNETASKSDETPKRITDDSSSLSNDSHLSTDSNSQGNIGNDTLTLRKKISSNATMSVDTSFAEATCSSENQNFVCEENTADANDSSECSSNKLFNIDTGAVNSSEKGENTTLNDTILSSTEENPSSASIADVSNKKSQELVACEVFNKLQDNDIVTSSNESDFNEFFEQQISKMGYIHYVLHARKDGTVESRLKHSPLKGSTIGSSRKMSSESDEDVCNDTFKSVKRLKLSDFPDEEDPSLEVSGDETHTISDSEVSPSDSQSILKESKAEPEIAPLEYQATLKETTTKPEIAVSDGQVVSKETVAKPEIPASECQATLKETPTKPEIAVSEFQASLKKTTTKPEVAASDGQVVLKETVAKPDIPAVIGEDLSKETTTKPEVVPSDVEVILKETMSKPDIPALKGQDLSEETTTKPEVASSDGQVVLKETTTKPEVAPSDGQVVLKETTAKPDIPDDQIILKKTVAVPSGSQSVLKEFQGKPVIYASENQVVLKENIAKPEVPVSGNQSVSKSSMVKIDDAIKKSIDDNDYLLKKTTSKELTSNVKSQRKKRSSANDSTPRNLSTILEAIDTSDVHQSDLCRLLIESFSEKTIEQADITLKLETPPEEEAKSKNSETSTNVSFEKPPVSQTCMEERVTGSQREINEENDELSTNSHVSDKVIEPKQKISSSSVSKLSRKPDTKQIVSNDSSVLTSSPEALDSLGHLKGADLVQKQNDDIHEKPLNIRDNTISLSKTVNLESNDSFDSQKSVEVITAECNSESDKGIKTFEEFSMILDSEDSEDDFDSDSGPDDDDDNRGYSGESESDDEDSKMKSIIDDSDSDEDSDQIHFHLKEKKTEAVSLFKISTPLKKGDTGSTEEYSNNVHKTIPRDIRLRTPHISSWLENFKCFKKSKSDSVSRDSSDGNNKTATSTLNPEELKKKHLFAASMGLQATNISETNKNITHQSDEIFSSLSKSVKKFEDSKSGKRKCNEENFVALLKKYDLVASSVQKKSNLNIFKDRDILHELYKEFTSDSSKINSSNMLMKPGSGLSSVKRYSSRDKNSLNGSQNEIFKPSISKNSEALSNVDSKYLCSLKDFSQKIVDNVLTCTVLRRDQVPFFDKNITDYETSTNSAARKTLKFLDLLTQTATPKDVSAVLDKYYLSKIQEAEQAGSEQASAEYRRKLQIERKFWERESREFIPRAKPKKMDPLEMRESEVIADCEEAILSMKKAVWCANCTEEGLIHCCAYAAYCSQRCKDEDLASHSKACCHYQPRVSDRLITGDLLTGEIIYQHPTINVGDMLGLMDDIRLEYLYNDNKPSCHFDEDVQIISPDDSSESCGSELDEYLMEEAEEFGSSEIGIPQMSNLKASTKKKMIDQFISSACLGQTDKKTDSLSEKEVFNKNTSKAQVKSTKLPSEVRNIPLKPINSSSPVVTSGQTRFSEFPSGKSMRIISRQFSLVTPPQSRIGSLGEQHKVHIPAQKLPAALMSGPPGTSYLIISKDQKRAQIVQGPKFLCRNPPLVPSPTISPDHALKVYENRNLNSTLPVQNYNSLNKNEFIKLRPILPKLIPLVQKNMISNSEITLKKLNESDKNDSLTNKSSPEFENVKYPLSPTQADNANTSQITQITQNNVKSPSFGVLDSTSAQLPSRLSNIQTLVSKGHLSIIPPSINETGQSSISSGKYTYRNYSSKSSGPQDIPSTKSNSLKTTEKNPHTSMPVSSTKQGNAGNVKLVIDHSDLVSFRRKTPKEPPKTSTPQSIFKPLGNVEVVIPKSVYSNTGDVSKPSSASSPSSVAGSSLSPTPPSMSVLRKFSETTGVFSRTPPNSTTTSLQSAAGYQVLRREQTAPTSKPTVLLVEIPPDVNPLDVELKIKGSAVKTKLKTRFGQIINPPSIKPPGGQ